MFLLSDDYLEIKKTKQKGQGVFSKKDIAAGTVIGDYIGKVLRTAEDDTLETDKGLYLMYYHDYASIYPVDIQAPGIHLLNHSCAPNCWMYTYKGHTLFFALRQIFAGEELTISYLLSPDDACMPCKHLCKCESILCSKTMHPPQDKFDKWSKFANQQAKETKRARIRYGQPLPMLPSYPKIISDHPIYTLTGTLEKPSHILEGSKLPSQKKLRELIRITGRTLAFPKLQTRIIGIQNDTIISEALED